MSYTDVLRKNADYLWEKSFNHPFIKQLVLVIFMVGQRRTLPFFSVLRNTVIVPSPSSIPANQAKSSLETIVSFPADCPIL